MHLALPVAKRHFVTSALGLAFAFFVFAQPAFAGQFTVKPIHVFMNNGSRSVVMTVVNESDTPLRLQVTGYQWSQLSNGEMQLSATDHLVFFPTLVTVAAKSTQLIRVAVDVPPSTMEQSYRLQFEELPSLASQILPEKGAHLTFRTRLGIPVFLTPAQPVEKTTLSAAWSAPRRLGVVVKNEGSVHSMLYNVTITGKSSSGASVFSKKLDGWYVLAQSERDFRVDISKGVCSRAASFHVTALLNNNKTISEDVTGSCAH